MLDYRIHTFLAVCKTMNFTRAGELLNITQPNVSQHIHWLEESYGQKLFDYSGRKPVLTRAGEILRRGALAMIHENELLKDQMSGLENQKPLFFGVTKSINEGQMKESVSNFLKANTGRRIRFVVDNTRKLLQAMEERKLDFAIVEGNFDKDVYDYKVLRIASFFPVCGREHRCAGRQMELSELCREQLLIREEGSGSREILEHLLESHNIDLKNFESTLEIGDIGVMKSLLKAGEGISFVYETAVQEELDRGSLVRIALKDIHVEHEFSMVWLKTPLFSDYYESLAGQFGFVREE